MASCRAAVGVLAVLACVLPALVARTSFAQNQDSGTIEGHVYGADTNGPIRIGNVLLKVVPSGKESRAEPNASWGAAMASVFGGAARATLHLDGSFAFSQVRPGRYLLYASAPGYVSPFDSPENSSQSAEQAVAANPVLVQLGPNQTVRANFELQRGAVVEGQVLFDDGSPLALVMVRALKKRADGKWTVVQPAGMLSFTDDRGHYRVSGLAAGKYLIEADLSIAPDMVMDKSVMAESRFEITTRAVYSGSVFDEKAATPFKLTRGEERAGEDLTFRASALHTVSGVVAAQPDGHPVSDAKVQIDAADGGVVETVHVLDASGAFRFEFVPEGQYTLKVSGARDADERGRTIREYSPAQQPLDVESDTAGLVIPVSPKK